MAVMLVKDTADTDSQCAKLTEVLDWLIVVTGTEHVVVLASLSRTLV